MMLSNANNTPSLALFATSILLLLLIINITGGRAEEKDISLLAGQQVTLTCKTPTSDVLFFVWMDKVFNVDQNPSIIYNSSDNTLKEDYKRRKFSITGKDLTFGNESSEEFSGDYFCRSFLKNGTTFENAYTVNFVGKHSCRGPREVMENDQVEFVCNHTSSKAGYWKYDVEMDLAENKDSEFGENSVKIVFEASWKHDKEEFECMIDNFVICKQVLRVKYKVRNLQLPSGLKNFHPGDNLTCQASGNPEPLVTLAIIGSDQASKDGKGMVSLPLGENLIGKELHVECGATNTVGGVPTTEKKAFEIHVTERPATKDSVLSGSNGSLLIIIVVVVVLLIILVIITIVVLRKKKGKKEKGKSKADATLLKAETKKDYKNEMI